MPHVAILVMMFAHGATTQQFNDGDACLLALNNIKQEYTLRYADETKAPNMVCMDSLNGKVVQSN